MTKLYDKAHRYASVAKATYVCDVYDPHSLGMVGDGFMNGYQEAVKDCMHVMESHLVDQGEYMKNLRMTLRFMMRGLLE